MNERLIETLERATEMLNWVDLHINHRDGLKHRIDLITQKERNLIREVFEECKETLDEETSPKTGLEKPPLFIKRKRGA